MQVTLDAAAVWAAIGAAGGVLSTAGLAWTFVVKPLRATLTEFRTFAEDWKGEPARPGVAARPGVMERMADHDKGLAELRSDLAAQRREPVVVAGSLISIESATAGAVQR